MKVFIIDPGRFDPLTAYAAVNTLRLDDMNPHIYRTHDGGKTWQKITNGLPQASVNAVREDHERKGLLFAATERGVHFSLDDGDHWQSLRLNLPATSVRDIVVKDDDLVVGTHGRSFWILDDITPIRQMQEQVASADVHLFKPQTAIRLRRDQWTDTPLPPEEPAGKNPPDGAVINYLLKTDSASPVTIEILNSKNQVIRKMPSTDPTEPIKSFKNVPVYWIRQPKAPAVTAGFHRFVWNMRLAPPDALEHEFPISAIYRDTPKAPEGPLVPPGTYTVRLTANGKSLTQPLVIKNDPRSKATAADFDKQYALEQQIIPLMHDTYVAVKQSESLNEQIEASRKTASAESAKALDEFSAKMKTVASGGQNGSFGADPLRNLETANAALATLLGSIGSADFVPTQQQTQVATEAVNRSKALTQQWSQLMTQTAGLKLDPNKALSGPGESHETENEE
jgi:hypothetical protein